MYWSSSLILLYASTIFLYYSPPPSLSIPLYQFKLTSWYCNTPNYLSLSSCILSLKFNLFTANFLFNKPIYLLVFLYILFHYLLVIYSFFLLTKFNLLNLFCLSFTLPSLLSFPFSLVCSLTFRSLLSVFFLILHIYIHKLHKFKLT